ncbi:MAG: FHA domain-containing protein [bacterium]|nr:FHA domain-containing protein [bacterium]
MASPTDTQFTPPAPSNGKRITASIFSGSGTGQSIALRRAVALVGSRPGCKITLKHSSVAAVHCAIVNTGESVYLRDLMSKTGTFLNGLRAECEPLSDGDIIRIADWEINVELRDAPTGDGTGSSVLNLEPTPTVLALKTVGNGPLVKLLRDVNVISRKRGADFVLQDRRVSRAHAAVFLLNGRPVICDLLSENGLAINEEATRFGALHSGDTLTLGDSRVRVVIPSPTIAASSENGSSSTATRSDTSSDGEQSDLIDIRVAEDEQRD